MYGDMEAGVGLDHEEAYRCVCVCACVHVCEQKALQKLAW